MSISLVPSLPQGELQQLLQFATDFRRDSQPYLEVIPKPTRKLNYRVGFSASSLEQKYSFNEYPALALGVNLDVFC